MDNLRNILKKINTKGELHFNEPMSAHTTFETGGPAEIYCAPADISELRAILDAARKCGTKPFILGGGANLLVSDRGIPGVVIDIKHFDAVNFSPDGIAVCGAGTVVDRAAEAALEAGFSGFDSFYGMPGTIGGAVWMNARCYGRSISDIIRSVDYLNDDGLQTLTMQESDFEYKKSPFQSMDGIIITAVFQLAAQEKDIIAANMNSNRGDREMKGHYAGPSAGSVFKNNRAFGKPSGTIIDSLSLRGSSVGGAKISDQHANIFINSGNAKSADIYTLIMQTQKTVKETYGFELEPEVQLIGDFTGII